MNHLSKPYSHLIETSLLIILLTLIPSSLFGQIKSLDKISGTWRFIPEESQLTFKIQNMYVFSVEGKMNLKEGWLKSDPGHFKVNVTIDAASLSTGIDKRDEHLRSKDFFFIKEHPQITFTGNNATKNTSSAEYAFYTKGTLSIRGQKHEETIYFNVRKNNQQIIVISGHARINRMKYNVDHQMMGIGNEAEIEFEVVAAQ
jgi:polyisoprenoid-binding protein YceI